MIAPLSAPFLPFLYYLNLFHYFSSIISSFPHIIYSFQHSDVEGEEIEEVENSEEAEDMYGAKYLPPIVRSPLSIGSSVLSPTSVRTYRNMKGTFCIFYFYWHSYLTLTYIIIFFNPPLTINPVQYLSHCFPLLFPPASLSLSLSLSLTLSLISLNSWGSSSMSRCG